MSLAPRIARTESVMQMARAVKGAFWDTSEMHVRRIVNLLAMGPVMHIPQANPMEIAKLAWQAFMAACAKKNAMPHAKAVNNMGASSTKLGKTIALHAQRTNLRF